MNGTYPYTQLDLERRSQADIPRHLITMPVGNRRVLAPGLYGMNARTVLDVAYDRVLRWYPPGIADVIVGQSWYIPMYGLWACQTPLDVKNDSPNILSLDYFGPTRLSAVPLTQTIVNSSGGVLAMFVTFPHLGLDVIEGAPVGPGAFTVTTFYGPVQLNIAAGTTRILNTTALL